MAQQSIAKYKYPKAKLPRFYANLPDVFLFSKFAFFLYGIGGCVALFHFYSEGFAVLAGVIWLLIFAVLAYSPSSITVSNDYLIFGEQLIYFANIAKVVVDEQALSCRIKSRNNKIVMIEADKFPTNARKDFKIKRNKADKFYKVVTKVLAGCQDHLEAEAIQIHNPKQLKRFAK